MKSRCEDAFSRMKIAGMGVVCCTLGIIQRYILGCMASAEFESRSSVSGDAVAFPSLRIPRTAVCSLALRIAMWRSLEAF